MLFCIVFSNLNTTDLLKSFIKSCLSLLQPFIINSNLLADVLGEKCILLF